jgi:Co/Zn/Cd efflux system component
MRATSSPALPLPATSAVEAQAATPDGQPWFYSYIRVCALLSLGLGVVAFLAGVVVFSTALASPRYMGEAWPLWLLAVSVLALLAGLFVAAALLLGLDAGESLRGLLRQGQARRRRPTEMAP